jgi:chromosome segregation ATPase
VKTNSIWVLALWAAGLGAGPSIVGCQKETPAPPTVSAADKAAEQKAAADKAAADRAAEQKAVAAKVAADKAAAEKAAGQAKAEASSLPAGLLETKAEIAGTLAQMDVTMAKLEALSASTGDLDKPKEGALDAIQSLETGIQAVKKRGEDMRDRGAAYFEAWEKELAAMSTPEVVAMATKRKDELSAKYAEVLTAMQETRSALDAYWSDMTAIRKAVDDLTPETLKLLAPQVKAAKDKATTLKSRVEATSAMLNQVSVLYTKS